MNATPPLSGYGTLWRFRPGPLVGALWFWAEQPTEADRFKTYEAALEDFQRFVAAPFIGWWE